MNKVISAYIRKAPENHRPAMKEIDAIIRNELPGAAIELGSGFPVYTINGNWVSGFATRKKGVMFYLMNSAVPDKHEKKLGRLRTGKSCIEYRETKDLSFPELHKLMRKMLKEGKSKA